jgi:predicted negative regulator of RcsB-dependent stress response
LFANIVVRTDDKAIDYLVTFRATIYLITLVIAAILVAFEWQTYMAANAAQKAEAAKAAAAAAKAAPAAPARARRTTKP